jgi:hypothetical protein
MSIRQKKSKEKRIWLLLDLYDPVNKQSFFEYRGGRGGHFPSEALAEFSGALQTDGYSGIMRSVEKAALLN